MRRYPIRQGSGKGRPSDENEDAARYVLPGLEDEGGVRNAKRQRANAVKTPSGIINVIFQDQVQAFRHEKGQTLGDLLSNICQHFEVSQAEKRQYELRDTRGAVCASKTLVESLLDSSEGPDRTETTLHLIQKGQQLELHQCWQFYFLKELRTWRVDPAYAAKYESILSDEDGVIRIASTQAVPVTEEHPIGVSATFSRSWVCLLLLESSRNQGLVDMSRWQSAGYQVRVQLLLFFPWQSQSSMKLHTHADSLT